MNTLNVIGLIADIIGILGAIFALNAWRQTRQLKAVLAAERARQEEGIRVVLQYGADQIDLPGAIRRADLSRAEILGRLGMIKPGARFNLGYINTAAFYQQLDQAAAGRGNNIITIACTAEEFDSLRS